MKLRYGIISCATIIDRFINAILEVGDSVVAIAASDITRATVKALEYGVRAYGSYEALYCDESINIVYIATNNANHVAQITLALQHGLHVVCEKPIALNAAQAIEVYKLAKEKNLFLMEAQKSVFLPTTNDIKQIIWNNSLGSLHQIEMSSSFPNPTRSWMHDPTQGGVIYGSANYTIELLDFLLEPNVIHTQACGIKETNECCERISMNFIMDDVLINSRISMHGDTQHHAIFYFEHGYIHVPSYWKATNYSIHSNGTVETIHHPITYEMIYEIEHIHNCIESKLTESPIMSAKRTIMCCQIVDNIIKQIS